VRHLQEFHLGVGKRFVDGVDRPAGNASCVQDVIHSALVFCCVTGISTSMISSRFVERALEWRSADR